MKAEGRKSESAPSSALSSILLKLCSREDLTRDETADAFNQIMSGQAAEAQTEAARPFEEKKQKGLQVWLRPVPGVGSKLDFNLDLDAGGVLPVLVTVSNVTTRTYKMDPDDVVLIANDGTRVAPLTLRDAAQRVTGAAGKERTRGSAPSLAAVTQELESHLFTARTVPAKQRLSGYLYYPVAAYAKGRAVLEDTVSEEAEGFVVEF